MDASSSGVGTGHENQILAKSKISFDAPVLVVKHPIIDKVITDKGGEMFRQNTFWHAYAVATALLEQFKFNTPTLISFPRGGVATGLACQLAFREQEHHFFTFPFGETGMKENLAVPPSISATSDVVLVDGVIATGSTLMNYLEKIIRSVKGWQGRLFVISNMAAERGINTIKTYSQTRGVPLACIATGWLIPAEECEWKVLDGKRVYFVGVKESIGDFGDMMISGLSANELKHWRGPVDK